MNYIGIVTFGNWEYTEYCIASILENNQDDMCFVVVVGDPNDEETKDCLPDITDGRADLKIIYHETNKGFPASLNDVYDTVYEMDPEADILFVGNDTMSYPRAVDWLFSAARNSDYDYLSGQEVNVRAWRERHPQYRGTDVPFWPPMPEWDGERGEPVPISRINGFHNFGLVRRSYFDAVGYVDPGFFPAYFEDNDYVTRGFKAGMKHGLLPYAQYFHWWSRTIHEIQSAGRMNQRYFPLNNQYYQDKWGGQPGQGEHHNVPFAGAGYALGHTGMAINPAYFRRCDPREQIEDVLRSYWKWTPRNFQNLHRGQRCVIVCNGPGLNDIDLSLLKDEVVFGLNRGYLKEDMPIDYLVSVNGAVLKQFGDEIVDVDTVATFIPADMDELHRPHVYGLRFTPKVLFQGHADAQMYQGHTVTYVALQLAYFMGFEDVAIVGMDHHFPRAEGKPTNKAVMSEGPDTDHFDPDYFGEGIVWEYPNLERSEEAYKLANKAFVMDGRRVVNCSTQTKLSSKIFPRLTLEEWKAE